MAIRYGHMQQQENIMGQVDFLGKCSLWTQPAKEISLEAWSSWEILHVEESECKTTATWAKQCATCQDTEMKAVPSLHPSVETLK